MRGVVAKDLYDRDFFEWTRCNAALLRTGRFQEADIQHIAEEIEDLGKRDRRELFNRLKVLLVHLLKCQAQPEKRSPSWEDTIDTQRDEIALVLQDAPSLKSFALAILPEVYPKAVRKAARETGLSTGAFRNPVPIRLSRSSTASSFPSRLQAGLVTRWIFCRSSEPFGPIRFGSRTTQTRRPPPIGLPSMRCILQCSTARSSRITLRTGPIRAV